MTITEHTETALTFLEQSDKEFEAGDALQGSEKLWGAAAHAVMSVAMQRGWDYGSHYAIADAAERLASEFPELLAGFSVAQKFHANFYHAFMEARDVARDRPLVHDFVHKLTAGG